MGGIEGVIVLLGGGVLGLGVERIEVVVLVQVLLSVGVLTSLGERLLVVGVLMDRVLVMMVLLIVIGAHLIGRVLTLLGVMLVLLGVGPAGGSRSIVLVLLGASCPPRSSITMRTSRRAHVHGWIIAVVVCCCAGAAPTVASLGLILCCLCNP